MVRDLGSLADFGPDMLDEGDYAAIEDSDYACLFNWAGTCMAQCWLKRFLIEQKKAKAKLTMTRQTPRLTKPQ